MEFPRILRSYTLTSEEDFENINNGKCPEYALSWGDYNKPHWSKNHDYIKGYLKEKEKEKKSLKIYCDLENVLVNFDNAVNKIFDEFPRNLDPKIMWKKLEKTPKFFENMEWLDEGKELWSIIKPLQPNILTLNKLKEQKIIWCDKNLGPFTKVYFHEYNNMPIYCDEQNAILIKTTLYNEKFNIEKSWTESGGIFINHKNNETTLNELKENLEKI